MRLITWNVNGIRAAQKKGFLDYLKRENPDVMSLQETKASPEQLDEALLAVDGYESHFVSAEKKGYSGVAIYTRPKPQHVTSGCGATRFDCEGRVISADCARQIRGGRCGLSAYRRVHYSHQDAYFCIFFRGGGGELQK